MVLSSVQELMRAALELGRLQERPVEFSGALLHVLISEDTHEQLEWTRRFVARHCVAKVTQVENYDAVRVQF
uniref:Uncharacterized protein n=1 Tax=viral metagenome TaxID=1070528 RepID=A0A6M3KW40_9ZZZZ